MRAAILVATALALAGCGGPNRGPTYPRVLAEAERAEVAGRYAEAAAKYDAAANGATRPRDRDHARWLAALATLRAGDVHAAVTRMDAIASASPPTAYSAEAAYVVADQTIERGDEATGWQKMEAVVTRFPQSGVAHRALVRVAEHKGDAALDYLRALDKGLGASELGEAISFRIAEALASKGDTAGARDKFLETATKWRYPFGALWDDSLWRASEMDEKLGRYPEAIADLERMLAEREGTSLVGTYQRPRMSPALLRVALIYRDKVHDHARARDALHRLYTDFTTSPLRDDALWLEASLLDGDGDSARACERLTTLVSDFPDSRYVPCAEEKCKVKRGDKSKAPKACHPYLLRTDYVPH